jgi:hypothetical protein
LGPRGQSDVHSTSIDSVSRDPQRVPFAAYSLHPVACARLIGDLELLLAEPSVFAAWAEPCPYAHGLFGVAAISAAATTAR